MCNLGQSKESVTVEESLREVLKDPVRVEDRDE